MKDPAALFYIDTWLSATAEMDSDVRGWYLNLILHNYDKKDLPTDIEKLAVLAGVKFSEFERFKQVFEQVLKQKFELNESNRLEVPNIDKFIISYGMQEGETHWNWNGGITSENLKIRQSKEYKDWRLKVFKRDGFRCTNCDTNVNIEAHHILSFANFPNDRFELHNGLTLCKDCHKEVHKSE